MPAPAKTSSQYRAPLAPSEARLHAAGVTVRGDRPEVSAVRTFEEFEGKARQMCGSGSPVVFTAVDWGLPRLVGEDVEQVFTVHTGNRIAIRLAREKAVRLHEALGMVLAQGSPEGDRTPAAPMPRIAPALGPVAHVPRVLTDEIVERAWLRFRSGAASVQALAHEHATTGPTLTKAFERTHGADFALVRGFYRGGRLGPAVKAAMDARLSSDRQPVTKPNGKLL